MQIQMVLPSITKSHKRSKTIEAHFYLLYSIMTGSKMAPNFEAVVSVLLQICGPICPGLPYP